MIHTLLALAIMTTGQCSPTTYVCPTYTYVCPTTCAEHQILKNTGPICSKFYTSVVLEGGYRTSIPVINCKLPTIAYQTRTGAKTLVLDYSRGFAYQNYTARPVKYSFIQRTPTRAARPSGVAPAPSLPTDPTIPKKVPMVEPTTPQPTGPALAPGLTTPSDEQIENLLNRIEKLEEQINKTTGMPTMKSPKVTVQSNKAESIRIPSAPTIPKDITPSGHPDDISKPTY